MKNWKLSFINDNMTLYVNNDTKAMLSIKPTTKNTFVVKCRGGNIGEKKTYLEAERLAKWWMKNND